MADAAGANEVLEELLTGIAASAPPDLKTKVARTRPNPQPYTLHPTT